MLKEKKFGYQEQNMREKGLEIKKERSLSNPKKKESTFWKTIKKLSPHVHWTRIETFGTPGIPDLLGVLDFKSFWLELKVTTKNRVHVSPFQIAWNQKGMNFVGIISIVFIIYQIGLFIYIKAQWEKRLCLTEFLRMSPYSK